MEKVVQIIELGPKATAMKKAFSSKKFAVLLNSIIFTICFNVPILAQRYMDYKAAGNAAIYSAISEFFFASFFVFPFLYSLLYKKNFILRSLLIVFYIFSGLAAYFIYRLNIQINQEIIASFFEASKSEIGNFISMELILGIICSGLLGYLCIITTEKSNNDRPLSKLASGREFEGGSERRTGMYIEVHEDSSTEPTYKLPAETELQKRSNLEQDKKLTLITTIFTLGCIFGDGDWVKNILPYNIIQESNNYFFEKVNITKKRLDLANSYNFQLDDRTNDLNIILIIGESARSDHFSLSGYKRETNPLLKKEKDNLIYYKDVTACYPLTRTAVPCMITRATRADRSASAKETSFIGVFKKLGFYSNWLGMQGTYTAIDAPYYDLAKEANKALLLGTDVEIFSSNDSSLFPFVDNFYKEHNSGRTLLVLHTYGSHFHYEERYTEEFRKFKPVCSKKKFLTDMSHCETEEIINSYDNSILFTDFFVKSIIDQVRDKKSLVIYTSDHGESLGENGRFLHGTYNAGEQIDVQMLFWLSDKYKQTFPDYEKALRSHIDEKLSHDYLFHSILGCSGIKSALIENKLNLCGK